MISQLQGKTVFVSGGGGGIGQAVVQTLLGVGARVASVDLPGKPCVEGALPIACDLSTTEGVKEAFRNWDENFDRLDVLVHAAGITRDAVSWKLSDEAWQTVMDVNLTAAFRLARESIPRMREGEGGSVILISSINGLRGKFGQTNYAASKAGLIGLGRSLAREGGAFGIRVNLVAPGLIETEMTAALPDSVREKARAEMVLGRFGEPDDVATAVLFFASSMSRHITGQVLHVDGGQYMA